MENNSKAEFNVEQQSVIAYRNVFKREGVGQFSFVDFINNIKVYTMKQLSIETNEDIKS